jgi:hypothetical protein
VLQTLSHVAKKAQEDKMMYWSRTLSDEAMLDNLSLNIELSRDLELRYDMTVLDSILSSIVLSLSTGVEPRDIPVFQQCFKVGLPSPEDYSRGKLIDIEREHCFTRYPGLGALMRELQVYLSSHFSHFIALVSLEKARYDWSMYGYSYYDPAPPMEFFRSTMLWEMKRSASPRTASIIAKSIAKALDLNMDVVDFVFTLSRAIERAKLEAAIGDYAWSDVTLVREEVRESVEVPTEDLELREKTIKADSMTDIWGGAYNDIALGDISFPADGIVPLSDEVPDPVRRAEVAIADMISREQRRRLTLAPVIVGNYQTAGERRSYTVSSRADTYGVSRIIWMKIREMVDGELGDLPLFLRNQYNVAVQQLYSRLTKDGGWGREAYRAMAVDQLKREWVEEWSEKGLDRGVLERLFDKAMKMIRLLAPLRAISKTHLRSRYMR